MSKGSNRDIAILGIIVYLLFAGSILYHSIYKLDSKESSKPNKKSLSVEDQKETLEIIQTNDNNLYTKNVLLAKDEQYNDIGLITVIDNNGIISYVPSNKSIIFNNTRYFLIPEGYIIDGNCNIVKEQDHVKKLS